MALGAVLAVVGGVIAAAGTIGLMLPAIKAGLAAMGAAVAGVVSAFATYFLPVVAVIGGVVLAVYLLRRAWETNFGGIRDMVLGAWEKVKLVFQGIRELISSLSGGSGRMSAELARKLEQAGLMGLVVTVFRIYYRVRQFLTGLWQAFSSAFGKIRAILEPAIQALRMVGRVVYTVWQVLTGDISVLDGLKSIGGAVFDFLATPFRWARDVIVGVWNFIRGLFSSIGRLFTAVASSLVAAFMDLPLVRTLRDVFGAVRSFFSGDTTFFEAGKRILIALGKGIWTAVTYPFELLKKALGWLRKLLPFSDAETGPLSSLTASGAAILKTLAEGMAGLLSLPGKVLGMAFKGMLSAVQWVWQGIKSLSSGILSALTRPFRKGVEIAVSVWRGVTDAAAAAWNGIKTIGASTFDAVASPFRWIGDIAGKVWDGIRSTSAELWSGLGNLAQSTWSFVSAPFTWIADAASGAWSHITNAASVAWESLKSMAQNAWEWIKAPFEGLATAASSAWEKVKNAASGAWNSVTSTVSNLAGSAFESGKAILTTVGDGIKSAVTAPYRAAKSALSFVRDLLPFSDAKEGPLANLTRSGAALIETIARGITRTATAPAEALAKAFGFMGDLAGRIAVPSALAGTLALTPVVTGDLPAVAGPVGGLESAAVESAPDVQPAPDQARLLGETRGALATGATGAGGEAAGENLRTVLDALIGKLDALADRPIEVAVTTLLDGRQVAQSVYRDIRERKIKNYETL